MDICYGGLDRHFILMAAVAVIELYGSIPHFNIPVDSVVTAGCCTDES